MINTDRLLTDSSYTTFFIEQDARDVLGEAFDHIKDVGAQYGYASQPFITELHSLLLALSTVLTRGLDRHVLLTRDLGLRSLYCEDGPLVYSVSFRPDPAHDGADCQPGTWVLER